MYLPVGAEQDGSSNMGSELGNSPNGFDDGGLVEGGTDGSGIVGNAVGTGGGRGVIGSNACDLLGVGDVSEEGLTVIGNGLGLKLVIAVG